MEDVLAGKATLVQVVTHYSEYLGGDDQAVARRPELLQGAPQNLFTDAERIDVRRIEEVDASLNGLKDEGPAFLFFQHPFTPFLGAIGHTAQANARHLYSSRTEI